VKSLPVPVANASRLMAAGFLGVAAVLFVYVAAGRFGVAAVAAPFAVVAAILLLGRPGVLLAILLVLTVMCEYRAPGLLKPTSNFYEPPLVALPAYQLLFVFLCAATALDVSRSRAFRLPAPFTLPLLLLAFALVIGVVNGLFSLSDTSPLGPELRIQLVLLLMPLVVVNVVRNREQLHLVLRVAAVVVALKAVVGLAAATSGGGTADVYGQSLTYYEPTGNWLMIAFLLTMVGALVTRTRVSRWLLPVVPLAFATLLLSYRRGWWIGTVVGLVVVVVVGTGPFGRRLLVPAVLVLGIAAWAMLSTGLVNDRVQGPVAERIRSLDPTKLQSNVYDAYRIVERRNVLASIAERPVSGLGLGARWTARYPVPVAYPDARVYTHIAALWYWLKLGILGLLAYVGLILAALLATYQVFRRHPDRMLRVAALGLMGAIVALAVTEMTESNTGVDPPFTVVIGAVFGLLACARAGLSDRARAPVEPEADGAPTVSRGAR
jgi:O-antigen ligase